jgi:polyhydroxybutyrate depolymerase
MKSRKWVIGVVLVLIGLPVVLVLIEAVSYHVQNRSNGTIVSSGLKREYLVYVPRSYDRTRPTPLVISMHGGAMWPAAQQETSQWNRVADEHGFIVVYPSGVSGRGPRAWRAGSGPGLLRDVRFISELIDTLRASFNIDPTLIYANGLSNGGGMAFVLSCTLSDRIAAVGVVAPALFLPWSACPVRRAVPMIAFHGTADRQVPYNGGTSWVVAPRRLPNIPAWTAQWARRNKCGTRPVESAVAADVTRFEYRNCAHDAAVMLYRVEGGGHTWPGGTPLPEWFVGPTSNGVDATRQMWAFFREHQLPRK